jgi:hypothetical protein
MKNSCLKINVKIIKAILVGVLFIVVIDVHSQSLNPNWNTELKSSLQEFMNCKESPQVCAKFVGKSLNTVYKVNDFYSAKAGRYMTAGEIVDYLKSTKQWSNIGYSYDQKVLTQAQSLANAKKAVVAVFMNDSGLGHVVVITPGTLQRSGSWGLDVPNAASFFATEPGKSFVDKSLSFAFPKTKLKDVMIYARNY